MDSYIDNSSPLKKQKINNNNDNYNRTIESSDKIVVGIIGTAGRKEDGSKITKELWELMIEKAKSMIEKELKLDWNKIILTSGGAAVADHIAVKLFLEHYKETELILELPCEWDSKRIQFIDIGDKDWKKNPGRVSNLYHQKFSEIIQEDHKSYFNKMKGYKSLVEIQYAIKRGAKIKISNGFHDRNNNVSKCDIMIAFTFGEKEPKDGGTAFTWNLCKSKQKYHVSINDLLKSNNNNQSNENN
jgi:hypothetical protein